MATRDDNPITGKEGKPIDLELAASWTKNYRDKHPGELISQFFGKEILQNILAQDGCQGIRFYYAHDKNLSGWQRCTVSISNFILKILGNIEGEKHLIITGVMSDGNDQLHAKPMESETVAAPSAKPLMAIAAPTVGEMSSPCPGSPGCPKNALTGG